LVLNSFIKPPNQGYLFIYFGVEFLQFGDFLGKKMQIQIKLQTTIILPKLWDKKFEKKRLLLTNKNIEIIY